MVARAAGRTMISISCCLSLADEERLPKVEVQSRARVVGGKEGGIELLVVVDMFRGGFVPEGGV